MDITVRLVTRNNLLPKHYARLLAESLLQVAPSLVMQRLGNHEPVTHQVGDDIRAELEDYWDHLVLWTRQAPRSEGRVLCGNSKNHSAIAIDLHGAGGVVNEAQSLIKTIATWLTIDLAYVYRSYDEEVAGASNSDAEHVMSLGVSTKHLLQGIPNLAWCNYFGPIYTEFIGRDRILSCPSGRAEDNGDGLTSLRLTDSIRSPYSEYEPARRAAKAHLGDDLFWDPRGTRGARRVPPFGLKSNASPGFINGPDS